MPVSRRHVLSGAGALGAGIAFTGAVGGLFAGHAVARPRPSGGYGPLVTDPEGILDLPRGFAYRILSREGDALRSGEGPVPSNFDGMSAFRGKGPRARGTHLVRNHENYADGRVPVPAVEGRTYDPAGKGGCTTVELDATGAVRDEYVSLAGTAANCSGGQTPWNTWLTCEETEDGAGTHGYTKDHGFIFEVDPYDPRRTGAVPLTAMGRFQHEAVAVDPATGVVYETEDAFGPYGLFYRFLPHKPLRGCGSLAAGGRLEAMRVPGVGDLCLVQEAGTVFEGVEWVDVPDPAAKGTPTRMQDYGPLGITRAPKLEGCYWGRGRVHFVSSFARTDWGAAADHFGQVWSYDPGRGRLKLEVVFGASSDIRLPGESPDNIALSPHGGLMVCEDGEGGQHVFGVDRRGQVYAMARNAQNIGTADQPAWGEFAGVVFSPDGRTMYVNCYTPGTTFAITGPW
ncbi:Tat pathway signal sequence domain protein [Streptomyces sp. Alain-F2R5]|nr:alkaline phosphatase PhoX [Streptomyces sp. Alain-F2R5]PAM99185.1 Tat pathway signal sequence domain protein [Streptomyces sp. Alain-F2R5]